VPPSYWSGGANISFGASVPGTVDVVVSSLGSGNYSIVSTGKATGGNVTIRRTVTAQVHVETGYQTTYASSFASNVNIPALATITGDVEAGGSVTLGGRINGKLISTNAPVLTGVLTNGWTPKTASNWVAVPTAANARDLTTYTYLGRTFNATVLGASIVANTVLGPTASNPAGVFKASGDLIVNANVQITGTLWVGGNLKPSGTGVVVTSALEGFPAAIVKGNIDLQGSLLSPSRDITFNGMTFVGGSIKNTGNVLATSHIDFNGAALFASGTPIDSFYLGRVNVNYDASKLAVLNVDKTQALAGVTVNSYKN